MLATRSNQEVPENIHQSILNFPSKQLIRSSQRVKRKRNNGKLQKIGCLMFHVVPDFSQNSLRCLSGFRTPKSSSTNSNDHDFFGSPDSAALRRRGWAKRLGPGRRRRASRSLRQAVGAVVRNGARTQHNNYNTKYGKHNCQKSFGDMEKQMVGDGRFWAYKSTLSPLGV